MHNYSRRKNIHFFCLDGFVTTVIYDLLLRKNDVNFCQIWCRYGEYF